MASIGFFLDNPAKERSSISIIIRVKNGKYKKGIGVSCQTKHWNKEKQRCRVSALYREGAVVNNTIDNFRIAAENVTQNIFTGKLPEPRDQKDFWEMYAAFREQRDYAPFDQSERSSFSGYFLTVFILRAAQSKSVSRIQRFKSVHKLIVDFEKATNRHLYFKNIDLNFYREIQEYLYNRQYSINYVGLVIKVIKQVMREAEIVDKLHNNKLYTHDSFKTVSTSVDTVYLNENELERLSNIIVDDRFIEDFYPKSAYSFREERKRTYALVRDKFLLGAYTGLRVSDYNSLRWSDIVGDRITVITQKTKQKVVIPMHKRLRVMMDRGFDIESPISEQKINIYIKDLCRYAGIDHDVIIRQSVNGKIETIGKKKYEMVTTHTARRSFATNAYLAGVPTIAIMKITGHTKESTFMKYIRITEEENANALAAHSFFRGE